MQGSSPAQRAALVEVRLMSDRLLAAATAQRREMERAQSAGGSGGAQAAGRRPAGADLPGPGIGRPRIGADERETLRTLSSATERLRRAREDHQRSLRRARSAGVPPERIAAEGRVSLREVQRLTEHTPVP